MKNTLLLLFLFFACHAFSQVNAVLPSEAKTFYENAMLRIKPQFKNLIEKNANKLTGHKINVDSLMIELQKNPLLKGKNEKDMEAITVLILVQVSRNVDNNLKEMVIHKKNDGNENEADNQREKNYASLLVENKSEIAQNVSFIMKKLSVSSQTVMDKFK
ncbi:MAG: hypothetical protein ABI366_01550 [Ginsengibacter sp.]